MKGPDRVSLKRPLVIEVYPEKNDETELLHVFLQKTTKVRE
jgi:hypothetical protein